MKRIALICTLMLVMSLAHKPSFAQQGATDTSSCAAHLLFRCQARGLGLDELFHTGFWQPGRWHLPADLIDFTLHFS